MKEDTAAQTRNLTLTQLKGTPGEIKLFLDPDTNKYIITDTNGTKINYEEDTLNNETLILKSGCISYFLYSKAGEVTKQTIKNYYNHVYNFIQYLESKEINHVNKKNVQGLLKNYSNYLLNAKGLSKNTNNAYQVSITQFFNSPEIMNTLGLTEPVQAKLVKDKDAKDRRIRSFNKSTYEHIIAAIPEDDTRTTAIIKTLGNTGVRVSELVQLNKQDIYINYDDPENPDNNDPVKIDAHGLFIKPEDTNIIYIRVKDGKSGERVITVQPNLLDTLNNMIYDRITKRYIDYKDKANPEAGKEFKRRIMQSKVKKELSNPAVFKNNVYNRCDVRLIQKTTNKAGKNTIKYLEDLNTKINIENQTVKEANKKDLIKIDFSSLNKLHPHLFRRFHANFLLNTAGVSVELVRTRLGHNQIFTTQLYVRPDKETQDKEYLKAMNKLNSI